MRVAAVQMPISDGKCEHNRNTFKQILDANPEYYLYLALKLWTSGYVQNEWAEIKARYS